MLAPAFAGGDASGGQQNFRASGRCYSLDANRNMKAGYTLKRV